MRSSNLSVAVKVQRPGVRSAIALDIFILRIMAGALRSARKLNTDLQVGGEPTVVTDGFSAVMLVVCRHASLRH